jgi:hypothetical protein
MKHKVSRSVFVLAVALGIVSVMVRVNHHPALRTSVSKKGYEDPLARPLACYRVHEEPLTGGVDYRGVNFKARVAESGCSFGAVPPAGAIWAAREWNVEFGSPRIEQGSFRLDCERGQFVRSGFGLARIDRGAVAEEYLFENRRVEQVFRIPRALGEGALRLAIPVKSDLDGPVVPHEPGSEAWVDLRFQKGGLAFCDASGATKLAYHSAVALDASGRQLALVPKYQSGEILLDVPAEFMARAEYPVVIDPWLDFNGSGSDGGISANPGTSENPTMVLQGQQPFIAWADNSAASNPTMTDIYLKWWNGFEFKDLGGSTLPGGISHTKSKASNPSLGFTNRGGLVLAWEDDSNGNIGIFVKVWGVKGDPGAGAWVELDGSASGGGIMSTFTPGQHPSAAGITGTVPGTITTDPTTGITSSTPSTTVDCPVVAFDNPFEGNHQIYCWIHYPGAPAQPVSAVNPRGLPAVPSGWYQMGLPNGQFVAPNTITLGTSISNTPAGHEAQYPSLVVDVMNRVAIAWQDSNNGVFEIYFKNFTFTAPPASTHFQIAPNPANPLNENDMLPPGNFTQIGTSASAGGVSNKGTLAQFPSLAQDSLGANFTIAWQQTEAAVPNPATSSQIYVARSTGAAAFAGLANSTAVGGISHTLNHAVTPSVDVAGGYIGVAWADDSNGRSSIYLRRLFLGVGGSGLWDQVGFQGSAFPAQGLEANAPIGGISQSANFSIQPRIKLDDFGSPVVVWADGSAASFDILAKVFSPNGPGIASGVGTPNPSFQTSLRQTLTDPTLGPATDIPVAGFAGAGVTVFLSSRVFTELLNPLGTSLLLEIEVQPQNTPFTNSPNFQSLYVAPDDQNVTPANIAVFKFDGLPNANYHWQARTSDRLGRISPWIQFPVDPGGVSFRINLGGGGPGGGGGGGGGGNGPANTGSTSSGPTRSKCGLTGLEGVALLVTLRLIRRRRVS